MRRVTDFRVDIVDIPTADWERLPANVKDLFKTYGTFKLGHGAFYRFELPIYRWEEINAALAEGQQSSELVEKTPSASPGERE